MLNQERKVFFHRKVNISDGSLLFDLAKETHILKDTCRPGLPELSGYNRSIKFQPGTLSGSFHPSFNSLKDYSLGYKKEIVQISTRCENITKTKSFVNN
jgi:hypothetical protein